MDVTFELTPHDVGNYRLAVRDRLAAMSGTGLLDGPSLRAFAVTIALGLLVLAVHNFLPAVTGAPVAYAELALGFGAGLLTVLAVLWLNYWDQSRKLLRSDGPTLSEHVVHVNASGLSVAASHSTAHYAWPAIQDVTSNRGLILIWLEPSSGLAVPERAFSSADGAHAFMEAVNARRMESGLPRAGSFG